MGLQRLVRDANGRLASPDAAVTPRPSCEAAGAYTPGMLHPRLRVPLLLLTGLLAGLAPCGPAASRAQDAPAAPAAAPETVPSAPAAVLETFKAAEVKKHIGFFTSKKCAGRASGLPGCDLAGEYIVERATELGLTPGGENDSYTQELQVPLKPFPGQKTRDDVGESGTSFNVIAILRGSDEDLRDEYVVMSAHYDHVGRKNKRKIFHGADDNASGAAALLQVARAFATPGAPRPRRSILFLWCTAEERGLLGSKYFVEHATVPVASMVANLNIDMVGRNASKEMHVYGNASSPDLDAAHAAAAKISGFRFLAKTGSIFLRSDQVNFYKRDIPALFFTSGLHKDYHATSDTAARIDTTKVSRAAKHAYLTAWTVAGRAARPRFTKMDASASAGPLGAVLDLVPRESLPARVKPKNGCGAALVRTVMDAGPAEEAGLRPGDFILEVGGKYLPEDDPVGAVEEAVGRAKKRIVLRVARGTRMIKVTVKVG